tara:strand:- start:5959 stop:6339 length:381 start_codon:yes stop_codon:yes gene_type:complete
MAFFKLCSISTFGCFKPFSPVNPQEGLDKSQGSNHNESRELKLKSNVLDVSRIKSDLLNALENTLQKPDKGEKINTQVTQYNNINSVKKVLYVLIDELFSNVKAEKVVRNKLENITRIIRSAIMID